MTRQAWLSLPLSVLIVLVAGVALSGTSGEPVEQSGSTGMTDTSGFAAPDDRGMPSVIRDLEETIDDVALRVFGTRDAAGLLLDANPDLTIEPDRPLPRGSMLVLP